MCENASFQETELMDKTVRNHTWRKIETRVPSRWTDSYYKPL